MNELFQNFSEEKIEKAYRLLCELIGDQYGVDITVDIERAPEKHDTPA